MDFFKRSCGAAALAAQWSNRLGCVLLAFMALLITADVMLRGALDVSIPGVFEVVEVLMGALTGCGLAYTGATHSHLEVEIVTDLMPSKARHAFAVLGNVLGIFFCSAVAWKTMDYAFDAFRNSECTPTTSIRIWPFLSLFGMGFFLLGVIFLFHVGDHIKEILRHDS